MAKQECIGEKCWCWKHGSNKPCGWHRTKPKPECDAVDADNIKRDIFGNLID